MDVEASRVEEVTFVEDDELSVLAQSQLGPKDPLGGGSEDSQQIIKTLAIINYLKIAVLIVIGFIIRKWPPPRCTGRD